MQLNPHTFPLAAYPGPAPEAPVRGEADGWGLYAQPAPSDRLLPFVLTRRAAASNAPWVSCAWLEHADTGVRVATLVPGGTAAVPALGLALTKLTDVASRTEYFTYDGARIPGLALPCGVPLRLILDNTYQSPRFYALAPAAQLAATHLLLEWYHGGPLNGVPYGRGFRQRYYLENGALLYADPRSEQVVSKDPDSGVEQVLSQSLFAQAGVAVPPVPAYLAQAFSAAQAVRTFAADGADWRLLSVKATGSLGRQSLALSLESREPLLSRGCTVSALATEAYDPAGASPRGWRCGDESDTAADYQPTGAFSCEVAGGANTGYLTETLRDYNRYSGTYGTETTRRADNQDLVRCPLPVTYYSAATSELATKNDCGPGFTGSTERYDVPAGAFESRVSQADADAKARAYAQQQAQAYANANGICKASGGAYKPTYTANGCFSGFMANENDATDVRDATQAEYAQYGGLVRGSDGRECPTFN